MTEASLLTNTILFSRALRERGFAVTPSETIDAITTLKLIDLSDRQETFLSLRSVLASRVEDYPVFEELFEDFWNRIQPKTTGARDLSSANSKCVFLRRSKRARGWHIFSNTGAARSPVPLDQQNCLSRAIPSHSPKKISACFEKMSLKKSRRLTRRIIRRLARLPSRRWKPVRRGPRVLLRRTLRRSLSTAGELVELSFARRKQKKTRLVVICDVSGSMDIYSRILLQFIYGLQNSFARVETFVFSTSLERITAHLKHKNYGQALKRLSNNVRGWSGGTLIGASLAAFNTAWLKLVDRRTIVIIMSDGWDTGEPAELAAAMAELKRRAGRLIWLNPLLGSPDYQPLVRGMQAALPSIDVLAPLR